MTPSSIFIFKKVENNKDSLSNEHFERNWSERGGLRWLEKYVWYRISYLNINVEEGVMFSRIFFTMGSVKLR